MRYPVAFPRNFPSHRPENLTMTTPNSPSRCSNCPAFIPCYRCVRRFLDDAGEVSVARVELERLRSRVVELEGLIETMHRAEKWW